MCGRQAAHEGSAPESIRTCMQALISARTHARIVGHAKKRLPALPRLLRILLNLVPRLACTCTYTSAGKQRECPRTPPYATAFKHECKRAYTSAHTSAHTRIHHSRTQYSRACNHAYAHEHTRTHTRAHVNKHANSTRHHLRKVSLDQAQIIVWDGVFPR